MNCTSYVLTETIHETHGQEQWICIMGIRQLINQLCKLINIVLHSGILANPEQLTNQCLILTLAGAIQHQLSTE